MVLNKQKEIQKWREKNGAASFDLKKKNIILHDGGLFVIEKEVKTKNKTKVIIDKQPNENGHYSVNFIPIKRNGKLIKEKVEDYKAIIWFSELDETINYFKRMKKLLNKLGYKTNH